MGTGETGELGALHPLEFRILLVLLAGVSHGYRIVKEIEEREGSQVYPANLYRRIRDLLARGWIETCEPEGSDAAGDRRRTYVRLTDLGRAVARAEARRLAALVSDARAAELLVESGGMSPP